MVRVYKNVPFVRTSDNTTPSAYYKDTKSGKMIPVDKRGNVMNNDPYYSKGDPRGWKRAGKGTKGYERSIHLDEKGNELR